MSILKDLNLLAQRQITVENDSALGDMEKLNKLYQAWEPSYNKVLYDLTNSKLEFSNAQDFKAICSMLDLEDDYDKIFNLFQELRLNFIKLNDEIISEMTDE